MVCIGDISLTNAKTAFSLKNEKNRLESSFAKIGVAVYDILPVEEDLTRVNMFAVPVKEYTLK